MKKVYLLGLIAGIFGACGQEKTYGGRSAAEQIEVVSSEISAYEYDGGRVVTRVRSKVTNTGKPLDFYFAVQLTADGQSYTDSIPLYLEKGDTLRAEIIFSELRYQEDKQPEMQHFIYPNTEDQNTEDAAS
jgi:hypothetical protein